jgi:hypothetical protein
MNPRSPTGHRGTCMKRAMFSHMLGSRECTDEGTSGKDLGADGTADDFPCTYKLRLCAMIQCHQLMNGTDRDDISSCPGAC